MYFVFCTSQVFERDTELQATNGRQHRAHHPGLLGLILGLAGDTRLRAARRLHSCTGRAGLGLRALNHRATHHRAGRALTDLAGLVAGADARRARGHSRLQNVLGHIRGRRALALQHIARHIGLGWAGRDGGPQHILRPVNLRACTMIITAAVAGITARTTVVARACTGVTRTLADLTSRLHNIDEAFRPLRAQR